MRSGTESSVNTLVSFGCQGLRARSGMYPPWGPDGKKHKMSIAFYALRDDDGTHLGCTECTQDVQEIRERQGKKRLLT